MEPDLLLNGIDVGTVDASLIREVHKKILEQTTRWLFGLDEPAALLAECLFMLLPYSDKISGVKLAGQPHIIFEGATGIGKTDLCQSIARAINAISKRVQGTPDLLPYDICGGQILVENTKGERRVQFKPGPIFAHFVLFDENNRLHPKSKSALLEAMEERSITPTREFIDEHEHIVETLPLFPITGDYHDLSSPRFFMALLTENPFDDEEGGGTYPNPRAQIDRMTIAIPIQRPTQSEEQKIRSGNVLGKSIDRVSNLKEILSCAHWINQQVRFSAEADVYLTQLLRSTDPEVTDPHSELGKYLKEYVKVGASPRVNLHLEAVARVHAFFKDNSRVVRPEHVKDIASMVLAHRLMLMPGKEFKTTKRDVFEEILRMTRIPPWT